MCPFTDQALRSGSLPSLTAWIGLPRTLGAPLGMPAPPKLPMFIPLYRRLASGAENTNPATLETELCRP